jgi:hypothetical protein
VVGLSIVNGGVNDHIDGHDRCPLLGVFDACGDAKWCQRPVEL